MTTEKKKGESFLPEVLWGLSVVLVVFIIGTSRYWNPHIPNTDDASKLIGQCGAPSLDESTENADPLPSSRSRKIEYKQYNVQFNFTGYPRRGQPPLYNWSLDGAWDLKTDKPITDDEAMKRMPCWHIVEPAPDTRAQP